MLETTWFVLWGLLWAIYFILDGFDLGMGTLLPFIAKTEEEKRTIYNAAGPFWDGNEVWLITAGGVTFAAFPKAYAVMFSALYAPLLILLFALIFRAVSFEFRSKIDSPSWRKIWDIFQFLGNFVPTLLLGVAFANLFKGIPIDASGVYHGNILKLLNPYGLMGGALFVLMFSYHGALWLAMKSAGAINAKAINAARGIWLYLLAAVVLFLAASAVFTNLYDNMSTLKPLIALPVLAASFLICSRFALENGSTLFSWICSSVFILCTTFFGVLGMYPGLIISSMNENWSVTIHNSASSPLTLKIMLGVVLCFIPIIIAYQVWTYITFSHKVDRETLDSDHSY